MLYFFFYHIEGIENEQFFIILLAVLDSRLMWQLVDESDKRISCLHSRSTGLLDNFVCFQCVALAHIVYRDQEG